MCSIDLLSEIVDNQTRDVVLKLNINDVSEEMVEKLNIITDKHKGKHSLFIQIFDDVNKYGVDLLSRKRKINLEKDFINEINEINELELKIKS